MTTYPEKTQEKTQKEPTQKPLTPITTHILNLATGMPAQNVNVILYKKGQAGTHFTGVTNTDGRVTQWHAPCELTAGTWVLEFATTQWFNKQNIDSFFDDVTLAFHVQDVSRHYHVPLLLNAFGYSTYRGS